MCLCVPSPIAEIEETIAERLIGLTEMVPDRVWYITSHS